MDILDDLKHMTYCECFECGSRHTMTYGLDDEYQCEECYRHGARDDTFTIEWKQVKKYMLKNAENLNEVMRIFVDELLNEEWDDEKINELCDELLTHRTLMGH